MEENWKNTSKSLKIFNLEKNQSEKSVGRTLIICIDQPNSIIFDQNGEGKY